MCPNHRRQCGSNAVARTLGLCVGVTHSVEAVVALGESDAAIAASSSLRHHRAGPNQPLQPTRPPPLRSGDLAAERHDDGSQRQRIASRHIAAGALRGSRTETGCGRPARGGVDLSVNPQLPPTQNPVLLRLLLAWEHGKPKALSVEALRQAFADGSAVIQALNDLQRRELARVKNEQGSNFASITPKGVDDLFATRFGINRLQELPTLSPAAIEELSQLVAAHYTGTEISALLQCFGYSTASWGSGTKWRQHP